MQKVSQIAIAAAMTLFAPGALAQADRQDTPAPGADGAAALPDAPSSDQPVADPASGDIIVTAQRRSQRLTDVPIAITTQTAQQLAQAGVTNVRDLTLVTPGLRISGSGANAQPAIRGIHSDQTDPGNDPNVSLYVDGVYQANQLANNADLPDVERVEVLKGPQGTLFGRNATGGAIRIFTREPTFTPTASVDIGYGSFNDAYVRGYLSAPIAGDVVAASISGGYERSDSYLTNIVTGRRRIGIRSADARGKLLIKPTDTLSVTISGAYVDRRDDIATAIEPLGGNTVARLYPGAVFPTADREFAASATPTVQSRIYTGSAKIDWTLGALGSVSSLTAYNDVKASYYSDADASTASLLAYPIFEKQSDVSEELIFTSSKFGIAQLTAGAFYYSSDGRYDPLILQGSYIGATLYGYMLQQTQAISGFGELTLTPLPRVTVIAGARYSHERRDASGGYFTVPGRPATLPTLGSASFDKATPRASIRYSFPSGDNVYFTYSQGFKSGGFNIAGLSHTAYLPETVNAYEVGLKTSPRRAISANLSAFLYGYNDQQVSAAVNGLNVTANAASSRIYGIDADVVVRPVAAFTTTIGLSYLHARFSDYRNAVYNAPTTIAGVVCLCGNTTTTGDLSGGIEPYSPAFTVAVTPAYHQIFAAGEVNMSASLYSTSRFFFKNNAGSVQQPAYATLAMRASFKPTGLPVSFYVYGKNLTDTRYFNTIFVSNAGDDYTSAPPRIVGVGARIDL